MALCCVLGKLLSVTGLALCGCARAVVTEAPLERSSGHDPPSGPPDGPHDASVEERRVAASELAWLVAHLADNPSPTRSGDSDNVLRLSIRGPEGARAAAEVFRVGDASRAPFARRVIERVATRQCHRDRGAASEVVAWIQRSDSPADGAAAPDGGFEWRSDDPRWPAETLARLIAWTERGAPCSIVAMSDGGVDPRSDASFEAVR